ncbi:replication protein A 30 kDa subunit-like [Microtus oregoni]|uniref:replication protein A 30 kDa subunit-like n=1 Tax=Microtus oregoni TaxID=111838 RepID=UPI001BB19D58|nr:replication protein A 30 kDa subunit-like [Microtus oregoni]
MSKGGFGSSDTFSGGDAASGASGSHEQARAQDLGLPLTILARPSIHSIVPCCISQLLPAVEVDNVFKIRGFAIHHVSIMGMIIEVTRASPYLIYKINDMTTKAIEARQPLAPQTAKQYVISLPVGLYAKVLGVLQSSDGTRLLGILSICVLEEKNELSTHTLEVVNARMMLEQSCTGVATGRHLGLNFIHMEVLRLVRVCPHQEGEAVVELQKDLVGLTEIAITKAIKYLIMMGHISRTPNCQCLKIVAETKN